MPEPAPHIGLYPGGLLSEDDLSEVLHVGKEKISEWCRSGLTFRRGRTKLFVTDEVIAFVRDKLPKLTSAKRPPGPGQSSDVLAS